MNMKTKVYAMLMSVLAIMAVYAADIPVSYTAGSAGDSTLAFTYSNSEIETVVANPGAGNRLVVTGDAMTFASGATITAVSGEVVFKNAATGHGSLAIAPQTDDAEITWGDGSYTLDKTSWTLLFPGKNLDEYEPTTAKGPTGSSNPPSTTALQFHRFTRSGSGASATLAFQAVSKHLDATNGKYIKVVKGTLRQTASGIEGSVDSAYLVTHLPYYNDYDDIDYMMAHPADYPYAKSNALSIPSKKSGYGIGILTMVRIAGKPSVRFENVLSDADVSDGTLALNVASGVSVVAVGANVIAATPYGGEVTAAKGGEFGFTDRSVATTRAFNLGGTFNVTRETALGEDACREYLDGYMVSNVWRAIPGIHAIEDLTNAIGVAAGGNVGGKNRGKPMGLYNIKIDADGFSATGQFQVGHNGQDKYTRFIRAEFSTTQITHQVSMRVVSAGYYETSTVYTVGYDLDALPSGRIKGAAVGSEWSTGSGYAILNITNYFSRPSADLVELSTSANSFANGAKVVVSGTENGNTRLVLSSTVTSLPTNGVLEIKDGGSAIYGVIGAQIDSRANFSGGTCPINVYHGGELIDRVETYSIGPNQEINLLGGTLRCGRRLGYTTITADTGTYVNLLTLADGALVTSPKPIRIGYQRDDGRWMVRGSSPSVCDAELVLFSRKQSTTDPMAFTFDVWDVTDSDAVDFTLNGPLGNKNVNDYSYGYIVKTGSGTMLMNGAAPASNKRMKLPIEIQGGTLAIGSAGAAQSSSATACFKLAGGNLAISDAVACTGVGPLTVAAAGTLKVGTGASIAFADSSAAEWTLPTGSRFVIDADLSVNSVRFGTTSDGLTKDQLKSIRMAGEPRARAVLDASGYLHSYIPGLIIAIH